MKNVKRQPQDEVPYEVWMKHILKAYRKDKERLEQLQRYAEGFEEENVALHKQIEQQDELKGISKRRKKEIKDIRNIIIMQEKYIGRLQELLTEHRIPFHAMIPIVGLETTHPLSHCG
jgi:hypothetical protein